MRTRPLLTPQPMDAGAAGGHSAPHALAPGCVIHWYRIETVLGQGGFGITYLAEDTNLGHKVALKEYFPASFAARGSDGSVHSRPLEQDKMYRWGLQRFLTEARTLAGFRHPNIVRVLSVFEEHATAYMVMEYESGQNLEAALKCGRVAGEADLLLITLPLLEALACIHSAGLVHRDIKPENIYLREDGSPVLLDFGSARPASGSGTPPLTCLVTAGYAPFEQYDASQNGERQGPWTDVYALAATLYAAVAGKAPVDSMIRATHILQDSEDPLVPAVDAAGGACSAGFLRAIDQGLAFSPSERPQSVEEWQPAFGLAGDHTTFAPSNRPATPWPDDSVVAPVQTRGLSASANPVAKARHRFRRWLGPETRSRLWTGFRSLCHARATWAAAGLGVAMLMLVALPFGSSDKADDAEGTFARAAMDFLGDEVRADTVRRMVETAFEERGEPSAYIVGEERGGALVFGARFGSGTLFFEDGAREAVHWSAPVVGVFPGRNTSKVVVLVYNLPHPDAIFRKFPALNGAIHAGDGAFLSYYQADDVVVAPIRFGGLLGGEVQIKYMHFKREKSLNPL